MRHLRLPLALLALPACLTVAAQESRQFGAWTAACDAGLYCVARGGDGALGIGRHAEEIYWEVAVTAPGADADAAFRFAVDDTVETFAGAAQVAAFGRPDDFYFLGRGIQLVMDRLMPARTAAIDYSRADGGAGRIEVPLDGMTRALIWIDEMQGRLGSERVAEAPPAGLDAIGPAGGGEVPEALLALRDADSQCRPLAELDHGERIVVDPALAEGRKLHILPCWDAAYNFGWRAWIEVFAGRFEPVALPEPATAGWAATTHLVNMSYDPATKQITTFYRARGMGDCGTAGRYRYDEGQFRLVEFFAREECGVSSADFPRVFPAN